MGNNRVPKIRGGSSTTAVRVGGEDSNRAGRLVLVRVMASGSEAWVSTPTAGVLSLVTVFVLLAGMSVAPAWGASRASIAAREKRFGRARIISRMRLTSATSSSALCTSWETAWCVFLGEGLRGPIVKASAMSNTLG